MRRWYEESGGFMEITGIPYDQLDYKNGRVVPWEGVVPFACGLLSDLILKNPQKS